MRRLILCLAVLWIGLNGWAHAENYAVLVGVSEYSIGKSKPQVNLEGPAYDLPALRDSLIRHGFKPKNVTLLLNEKANRHAILENLQAAVLKAQPGDFLVFYFSGHGTSSFDQHNRVIATGIGPNTGAIVPYDFNPSSRASLLGSLIVGRRDLRPILEKLDRSAKALVILDACYSQDSAKDLELRGVPRYLNLEDFLPRGLVLDTEDQATEVTQSTKGTQATGGARAPRGTQAAERSPDVYPYSNVISLSASAKNETAVDIGSQLLSTGRIHTVDNHPHGAFTNSLLMGLNGAADINRDGAITVDELYHYTRENVRSNFKHTPQILQPDGAALASTTVLTSNNHTLASNPSADSQSLSSAPSISIMLQGVPPTIGRRILGLANVAPAQGDYDFLIRATPSGYQFYDGSRTLIHYYAANEVDELVDRIGMQSDLRQLFDWRFAHQDFNLTLDVTEPRLQGEYYNGQHLKVSVSTDQPCYLLLLDIDSGGSISVLYPGTLQELAKLVPGVQKSVIEGVVGAPFGMEHLKAFAFREKPVGYERWACSKSENGSMNCPNFKPGTHAYYEMLQLLQQSDHGRAQAQLRVVSSAEPLH